MLVRVNTAALISLAVLWGFADDGVAKTLVAGTQASQQTGLRDPFTPSALMYDNVGAQAGAKGNNFGFVPSSEAEHIPQMKLRGLLNQQEEEFIALLEVKGVGTFMVREGDEFNIDPSQPKNAIRISKITRLSVTVETGRLGSIRVLR